MHKLISIIEPDVELVYYTPIYMQSRYVRFTPTLLKPNWNVTSTTPLNSDFDTPN